MEKLAATNHQRPAAQFNCTQLIGGQKNRGSLQIGSDLCNLCRPRGTWRKGWLALFGAPRHIDGFPSLWRPFRYYLFLVFIRRVSHVYHLSCYNYYIIFYLGCQPLIFGVEDVGVNKVGNDATSLCIKGSAIRHHRQDKSVLINVGICGEAHIPQSLINSIHKNKWGNLSVVTNKTHKIHSRYLSFI